MRRLLTLVLVAAAVVLVGPAERADALMVGLTGTAPVSATTSAAKTLTATCPAGTQVLAAGADTTPGNGRVLIDRIRPNAALTQVSVHAVEDEVGTPDGWLIQAYAICARPPAGVELVSATSPAGSAAASVTASCPAGKRVMGTGAELLGGAGEVLLDGIVPNKALTSVTVNAVEDETGTPATWSVTAYAICSARVSGLQRVEATSAVSSDSPRTVTVNCPTGTSLLGMGGTVNGAAGQVVLDATWFEGGSDTAGFKAWEDRTGSAVSWGLTVYGICAAVLRTKDFDGGSSNKYGGAFTTCSNWAGTLPLGMGMAAEGVRGRGGVVDIGHQLPSDVPEDFRTYLFLSGSLTFPWRISYQLNCAAPLPEQETVVVRSPFMGESTYTMTATCPTGTRVVGIQGGVEGNEEEVFVEGMYPNASATAVTVTAAFSELSPANTWQLTARAVCAAGQAGVQVVTATSETSSEESNRATATCPAGKHVLALGARVLGGTGQVLLNGFRTDAARRAVTATAYEDATGYGGSWSVTAYAVCVSQ